MSDWAFGLATISLIIGGAFLYAGLVLRWLWTHDKPVPHPLRRVADEQAAQISRRAMKQDGLTEIDWLYIAAHRLLELWPGYDLNNAVRELRDYMPDTFGHIDYDWSKDAAHELAEEYARDFGEQFGDNR